MTTKFHGTVIGLFFSVASWLATYTIMVPILTIIPLSLTLESIFKGIYADDSYYTIGPSILFTLWGLFLLATASYFIFGFFRARHSRTIPKWTFILFLVVQFFIVHTLGFYIDTAQDWGRASDGQFIMGVLSTFPSSSIAFVILGLFLDGVRNFIRPRPTVEFVRDNESPTTHNSAQSRQADRGSIS